MLQLYTLKYQREGLLPAQTVHETCGPLSSPWQDKYLWHNNIASQISQTIKVCPSIVVWVLIMFLSLSLPTNTPLTKWLFFFSVHWCFPFYASFSFLAKSRCNLDGLSFLICVFLHTCSVNILYVIHYHLASCYHIKSVTSRLHIAVLHPLWEYTACSISGTAKEEVRNIIIEFT